MMKHDGSLSVSCINLSFKGVNALREGGILAYITNVDVKDSIRKCLAHEWLINHALLVSIVRLPKISLPALELKLVATLLTCNSIPENRN